MSQAWLLAGLALWVLAAMVTSRPIYLYHLRHGLPRRLRRLGLTVVDLVYTFDRMVYVVPVPNFDPAVRQATPADLAVELQTIGVLFPRLEGARILLRMPDGVGRQLAFVAVGQLWSPRLDQLRLEGRVSAEVCTEICAGQLVQPATLDALKTEVLSQLRLAGRYV